MIRIQAPAKINLFLRVLKRRPDGYHELETLFERIDLADELKITLRTEGLVLSCSDPSLPVNDENLIIQAARLLQESSKTKQGASITLTKRIPVAAGLGGGSSDAAATLIALNHGWNLGFSQGRLRELAAKIGADVPFFVTSNGAYAIGRGRGDLCEPLTSKVLLNHVLVVPDTQLLAREVYQGLVQDRLRGEDSPLTGAAPSINILLKALHNGSLSELAKGMWNDLEPEAIRRCPISAQIQSMLQEQQCLGTLVSGSGPAVFGLCRDDAQAAVIRDTLRATAPSTWRIEAVRTLGELSASVPGVL